MTKKILITGKNSYVGNQLAEWLNKEPEKYEVVKESVRDDKWKEIDFSIFDVVVHVAGIAHVSSDPKMEDLYYKVNRDLTIEIAKKAKFEGVKQFIFMSSIIVYGDSTSSKRVITKKTIPNPNNFYGNSKLQAEEGIKTLGTDNFKVVIVRPPMIYGEGSKGNYLSLSKLAKTTPIFPCIDNERSMLHIDNLCEFLKAMIDYKESGIFFPQNREYVKTSEMVRLIGEVHGRKIKLTRIFNPMIKLMFNIDVVSKVFGNLVYEQSISKYERTDYQIREFAETIKYTELEGPF